MNLLSFLQNSEVYLSVSLAILTAAGALYFTLSLGFIQIRYMFYSFRVAVGLVHHEAEHSHKITSRFDGEMSYFRSLSVSISAVAGNYLLFALPAALLTGGIGSIFWMWVFGLLAMSLRYAEGLLANKYRDISGRNFLGGLPYILRNARGYKVTAKVIAGVTILAAFVWGALTQSVLFRAAFSDKHMQIDKALVGSVIPEWFALAFLFLSVFFFAFGRLRRLGRATAYFSPVITGIFLLSAIYILFMNRVRLPGIFSDIFQSAFQFKAVSGAALGALLMSVFRTGVFRGYMPGEEHTGHNAVFDGASYADFPVKQGLVSMAGVMLTTLIFAPLISLLIAVALETLTPAQSGWLSGGVMAPHKLLPSTIEIIIERESALMPFIYSKYLGHGGNLIISIVILFYGSIAISSWIFAIDRAAVFLKLRRFLLPLKLIFLVAVSGSLFLDRIYPLILISSILFSFMAYPNLFTIFSFRKEIKSETKEFFGRFPHKHDLAVKFYLLILSILPKNKLSKLVGFLAGLQLPRFIMIPVLLAFARIYKINVQEAELELKDFKSLNKFFTRTLKNGARIIDPGRHIVVSPVDGTILNFGSLEKGKLVQTKGIESTLSDLLGTQTYYKKFLGGCYMTIYLSPQDYHRIHSPISGRIIGYYYQPGKLFPVNNLAVSSINQLFSRNERLITYINTKFGMTAVIKVGATSVGRIVVTYDDDIATNSWIRLAREKHYPEPIFIQKGEELGRFEMGSTVMLLFEKNTVDLLDLEEKQKVLYGQPIGVYRKK